MKTLVIGLGYVGRAVALQLAREGHAVTGLRLSNTLDPELEQAGVNSIAADISAPWESSALAAMSPGFQWVVNCAAPAESGPKNYEQLYLNGSRNVVRWLSGGKSLLKYVYTSSTGVYGQDDGSLVTEEDPAVPASETGKILAAAEQVLLEASSGGFPAVILRVAGIYGPGRGYWLRQFMAGAAVLEGDGSRILNMVHQEDVVGAITAALTHAAGGEVFNVADFAPSSQLEVFRWLSGFTGKPMPEPAPAGASVRTRTATKKRISNRKLVEKLGYAFKHPTFREGFASLL